MSDMLSAIAFVVVCVVCTYFGPPRGIANTVALRSSKSTDELMRAAKLDDKNSVAFNCWLVGGLVSAVYGLIFGLVPSLLMITVASMIPFVWVRAEQYYRLGRD